LRGEAKLAAALLLQRRGHERGVGLARVGLVLDGAHGERRVGESLDERARTRLVHVHDVGPQLPGVGFEVTTGRKPLAVQLHQGRRQRARRGRVVLLTSGEGAFDVPVRRLDEAHPSPFALHHDARRDGLHPTGGEPGHDLLPQDRRHLVAVQPVEDAPRLLRVDQ
jgi:hypothetical protein